MPTPSIMAQLVLKATGEAARITAYSKETDRWSVVVNDGRKAASGRELTIQVDEPCRPRRAILHSLKRRASLNGQRVLVSSYQARTRRFALKLERDGMGLQALPSNLRWEDALGSRECLSEPVRETRRAIGSGMALHATWAFEPGQLILEEAPTIMNQLSAPNGDYPLAEALNAFFALSAEDQAQLLSLQPSDTGVATLAAQGGVDPSGRGGPSDSAAVVEQLCRVEGCRVPPGRESDAALFLQILDANGFQCE